jgi:hypothetical protein
MAQITLDDKQFWSKISASCKKNKVGHFNVTLPTNGMMHLIAMSDSIKMIPFMRAKEELFETTVVNENSKEKYSVIINGPTYGLTQSGKVDALLGSDPVPASETIQQGRIVRNNKVIGGKPSNMYYVANNPSASPKYTFGKGTAPMSKAAIGNMGPLIINGLNFGPVNVYSPIQPNAKRLGEPSPKHATHLIQRSNRRFSANMGLASSTGKVVIAHIQSKNILLILIQPHGNIGISITGLRDLLSKLTINSAVYLDGSDSVMLMVNGKFLVRAASNKNETNVTGIGFKY